MNKEIDMIESKIISVRGLANCLVLPFVLLFFYTLSHAQLTENCTVSLLNRTAQVKAAVG
jgi:hypothetical protein